MVTLFRKWTLTLLIGLNIGTVVGIETHCNGFRCKNNQCILDRWKCDGKNDCLDGSDEEFCPEYNRDRFPACTGDRFPCGDGLCVFKHEVCDGFKDCINGAEEMNCTIRDCTAEEYQCPSSKRCIPIDNICDGDEDCTDGSDEDLKNCTRLHNLPTSTTIIYPEDCEEFFCNSSRKCLPWSKVCDGHEDCTDATDEAGLCALSCLYNEGCSQICRKTPKGSVCACKEGFLLSQDGKTCEDINECIIPGYCSHFCNNTNGGVICSCAEGYYLDTITMKCKADGGPGLLAYMLPDEIWGIDLDTYSQKAYIKGELTDMRGIDFDAAEGALFWSSFAKESINIYKFDTKEQDTVIRDPLKATHIKRDWITKNIYYTDGDGSIKVCDKSGTFSATLLPNIYSEINSFTISPPNGMMFWSVSSATLDDRYGVIERAELDGTHRLVIVSDEIMSPKALAVDEVLKLIFWTDFKLNTLFFSDFHGLHRTEVLRGEMSYPFSMTLFEDYVFWADWGTDTFMRCEKLTGKNCLQLHKGNVRAEYLTMIHRVNQPAGKNRCAGNSCPQLCLPTRSGFKCKCSDNHGVKNVSCSTEAPIPTKVHLPMLEPVNGCSKSYCMGDAKCVVVRGNLTCWCPLGFTGRRCEERFMLQEASDYTWVIPVAVILTTISIIGVGLLCKKKFLSSSSTVEKDDLNAFDVIVLKSHEDKQQAYYDRKSSSKSGISCISNVTST